MNLIEQIKQKLTCLEVANMLSLPIKYDGDRCKSFRVGSKNATSLQISKDFWHDYADGNSGDCINLYANFKNIDNSQAIRELGNFLGLSNKTGIVVVHSTPYERQQKLLNTTRTLYNKYLNETPQIKEYLTNRGLTNETINKCKIGFSKNPYNDLIKSGFTVEEIKESNITQFTNRIMFPYLDSDNNTRYFIGRKIEEAHEDIPKYTKLKLNDFNENIIYSLGNKKDKELYITEGIMDALTIYQEGYSTISPITGRFSSTQKKDLLGIVKNKDVTIILDYDPKSKTGQKASFDLAEFLYNHHIDSKIISLNEVTKNNDDKIDINSYYMEYHQIDFLNKGKTYAQIRGMTISSESELEAFINDFVKNCISQPKIVMLEEFIIKNNKTGISKTFIKEVFKMAKKAPTEATIISQIHNEGDFVYHPQLKWYVYKKTFWEKIEDKEMQNKCVPLLGKFCRGSILSSLKKYMEVEFIYSQPFNNKNHLNFTNGMLNLDTKELEPHSKDFMSTIQHDYDYNKDDKCPKWEKVIAEICNNDQDRLDAIQEMFGYCLTTSVSLQKAFFLIGNGSNGKSLVLNVLEKVVHKNNCSNLELDELGEGFRRISLYGKTVNIGSETKTNINGAENTFKKIVGGDTISGSYKGVDNLEFRPFAKMVFAMNDMPKSKDITHGFLRRIHFIEFPIKFVIGEPKHKNERRADVDLTLDDEISGIINWSLIGLDRVNKNRKLTETKENKRLSYTLKEISNPVQAWLADKFDIIFLNGTSYQGSRQELFDIYRIWCSDSNVMLCSMRNFFLNLNNTIPVRNMRLSNRSRGIEIQKSDALELLEVYFTNEEEEEVAKPILLKDALQEREQFRERQLKFNQR